MRIGLDAMGGDHAPNDVIEGAVAARESLAPDDIIALVGRQEVIEPLLEARGNPDRIEIIHAPDVIGMGDPPVEAVRTKPDSSILKMTCLQRDGELDACISAGNTGACVAAAQMRLHRLPGVHRPGIAVLVPSFRGPVAICDVGANVNCRPQHLYQYGVMTTLYMQAITDKQNPKVGLLSVGEEEGKGNDLVKKTTDLLKSDPGIQFIGNVEGSDVPRGTCDITLCEGFVGNVVLKLVESMGVGLVKAILEEFSKIAPEQMPAILAAAGKLAESYDFNTYGGTPLLGVNGIWIICHGASNAKGISNAVRVAKEVSAHNLNEQIVERLSGR